MRLFLAGLIALIVWPIVSAIVTTPVCDSEGQIIGTLGTLPLDRNNLGANDVK